MLDRNGNQIHYRKGTKVLVIRAFDGSLFSTVNDTDVYALELVPDHENKSKNFDADYTEPTPRKRYIPPLTHPWRKSSFERFVST